MRASPSNPPTAQGHCGTPHSAPRSRSEKRGPWPASGTLFDWRSRRDPTAFGPVLHVFPGCSPVSLAWSPPRGAWPACRRVRIKGKRSSTLRFRPLKIVFFLETVDPAAFVHQTRLRPGVEGVAGGAHLDVDVLFG